MRNDELIAAFNQQASGYDRQWAKLAPIRDGLHFLLESVFAELPVDASVLCVGAGTGSELIHLAKKFPGWKFTVVEPSGAMLDVCRYRAEFQFISTLENPSVLRKIFLQLSFRRLLREK